MKKIIFSSIICIFYLVSGNATDTLIISNKNVIDYNVYDVIYTFEDSLNKYSVQDIEKINNHFEKHDAEYNVNFGFNKHNCWIRFSVKNETKENLSLLLIISNPDLNYLDFYEYKGDVKNKGFQTGELKAKNSRPFSHRYFLFELELESDSVYTYYLRSNNIGDSNLIPISLQKESTFFKDDLRDQFFYSFIYGILILIVGFNIYLYRTTKDKVYLSYFAYVFFVIVFMLSLDGYIYFLSFPWLSNMGRVLIPAVAIVYFISFSQKFLESRKKWPSVNIALNVMKLIMLIIALLPIINFELFVHPFVISITPIYSASLLIFFVYAFKYYNKEYLPSQYFLFAFIVMLIFTWAYPLRELGVLPYNFFTINGVRIGFVIQTILLTIAVLERFRIQQEDAKKAIEESRSKIKIQNKELEIINTELEKLSIVASETDNSVAIYDNKGKIEWCNEGFERFYEIGIDQLIKQNKDSIEEIIPFNNIKKLLENCIAKKEPVNFETELKFNGRRSKWMRTTLSPYVKGNKVIAVDTDITSLKDYEADLKYAKEKAEESDRLKTIFLSNMSHEVRTPLNGILGFSELLNNDDLSRDEKEKFVEVIKSNGEQLIRIIDDILDMSLIESNQLMIRHSDFSLTQLCEELVEFFKFYKSSISKSEVKLVKELNISRELDFINSDKARLKQVLMNLLKNGFKFTDEGYIKLGCYANESSIMFFVEDTGIGIDPSKVEDIFERFRQADERSTRRYGGNGLGLTISKGIVEKMDGKIWIDPEYSKGFRICFVIPLIQSESVVQSNEGKKDEQQKNKIKGKKILIVEDHDVSYQYLYSLLQSFEVMIERAIGGIEAIKKIKNNNYDLVLMDINIPELDGIEATKEVRKFNKRLPIIAQTAHAMPLEETVILESGCNSILIKPINSKKLLDKIEAYL